MFGYIFKSWDNFKDTVVDVFAFFVAMAVLVIGAISVFFSFLLTVNICFTLSFDTFIGLNSIDKLMYILNYVVSIVFVKLCIESVKHKN